MADLVDATVADAIRETVQTTGSEAVATGGLADADAFVPDDGDSDAGTDAAVATPTQRALGMLRTTLINLVLPFINGLMLGFGEILAHEVGFRWGWSGARVYPFQRNFARPGGVKRE
ncbi:outer membrane protein TOM13-domain-containing protein [Dipodascopsis tothii]|uniref:outer membrane protein TOM13-domain-containing protein n=1 Tax=Dipodascopsis tothii TaxID=44089 RepID=UPI0034CFA4A6